MDDQASITDEVTTPTGPVRRPGSPHARGVGEGFGLAIALVALAGGLGFVAVSGPRGATPDPTANASDAGIAEATLDGPPESPNPSPTRQPAVTPSAPCARSTPPDPPIAAVHYPGFRYYGIPASTGWLIEPLPTPGDAYLAEARVKLGDPLGVSLDNRWCALAWRFYLDGELVAAQANPDLDPAYASQDAWFVQLPPTSDPTPLLRVELRFRQGWTIDEWRLAFDPPPIPTAFVATRLATEEASPGCGFRIQLQVGAPGNDSCQTSLPAYEPAHLQVAPDDQVAFRVPGATFVQDPAEPLLCGRPGSSPADFQVNPGCVLGEDFDPSNALTFLAPSVSGAWWIAIQGCASRNGNQACGRWYTILDVATPATAPPGTH